MAQVFLIGSITADLELRISARKVPYIRFGVSEPVGYKDKGGRQDYQVWAFGSEAERLANMNVRKGSLFWISGQLRLVDDLAPDRIGTVKVLKVMFKDGGYVAVGGRQDTPADPATAAQPAEQSSGRDGSFQKDCLDGDREPLPG